MELWNLIEKSIGIETHFEKKPYVRDISLKDLAKAKGSQYSCCALSRHFSDGWSLNW